MFIPSSEHEQWNALVRQVALDTPLPGVTMDSTAVFHFPFETTVRRAPRDATARLWKINIVPGTLSDNLVMYPYWKTGDKRGWKMPKGYLTPALEKAYGLAYPLVDRSPFEMVDPPYLLVRAPGANAAHDPGDFTSAGGTRPTFFQQTAFKGCSLWYSSVVASARPYRASPDLTPYNPALQTKFNLYRYYAGHTPGVTDGVNAGGWVELSRLWLARKPDGTGPKSDRLYVSQYHFWCMQCIAVEPSAGAVITAALDFAGIYQVGQILQSSGALDYWSC